MYRLTVRGVLLGIGFLKIGQVFKDGIRLSHTAMLSDGSQKEE
jgi:hypothetical protein